MSWVFFFIFIVTVLFISGIYYCSRKSAGADGSTDMNVSDSGICAFAPDTLSYRIREAHKSDNNTFVDVFLKYLIHATKVPHNVVKYFVKKIDKWNDRKLLEFIIRESPKIEGHGCCYSKKVEKTGDEILTKLRRLSNDEVEGIGSYLDIGATATGHLDIVANSLGIPIDKCFGLNVASDNPSALKYGQADNKRIVIYDGMNIPDIIGGPFDLVTIISVIHHIPPEVLKELVVSIAANCKRYLLIKECDICDKNSQTYFIWQHLVFWRSTKMKSYTRCDITSKKLVKMLSDVGFKFLQLEGISCFTRATWHLFERIQDEK